MKDLNNLTTPDQIRKLLLGYNTIGKSNDFVNDLKCDKGMCKSYNDTLKKKKFYQYLPNPLPKEKVKYIFIGKEPSTPWAGNEKDAYKKVMEDGYMNFSFGDTKYLKIYIMLIAFQSVFGNKGFYLTDLSKCAINTKDADDLSNEKDTEHRYICCSPFLNWELKNLVSEDACIFLVGKNYFFDMWYKKNNPKKKTEDFKLFHSFLKDEVAIKNIPSERIYQIPHYSIRFSCPDMMLRLLNKNKENVEYNIQNKLIPLLDNCQKKLKFSENTNQRIIDNKEQISKSNLTDSSILLYLLFENEFNLAKNMFDEKLKNK